MTDLTDRVRQHEAPHIRHIDVQTLDALLRIEELLKDILEGGVPRAETVTKVVEVEVPADKPKNKKNARQL
jgi:hypothetical protein